MRDRMGRAVLLILFACLWTSAQELSLKDAASLLEQGKTEQAAAALDKIVAASPSDVRARNLLGIALSRMGRQDAAKEQFTKALELDPSSLPSMKNLALSELALGRFADARRHFETVVKSAPNDPAAHLGLAEVDFAQGRFQNAAAEYKQSGALYLNAPVYALHYAQTCVELKEPRAAAEALERMPDGADAQTHFAAGVLLAGLEQYKFAAVHFEAAVNGLPEPYDAGYNLTLAYLKSQQPKSAVTAGEALLARGYKKAELYNLLAQAYEQSGRTKDAYGALRTATELDPNDEANYLDLISLCLDHQNWDLSLEIAGVALARLPGSYRLHLQRGAVLAMKTQYDEAEQEFKLAVRAAPALTLPHVSLALVEMQTNKLPAAIDTLRERRKAAPKDYLVNWFLGEALNRNGALPGSPEEAEAVSALKQSVASNPKAEQARLLLGKFLLKRGETDAAIEQFNAALALDPEDSSAMYQLAQAYRKRGDTERAAQLFAKVSQEKAEAREQFTRRNLVRIIREGTQ